jgi:PIN domain nuclease of toxin-antitoxin system
VTALLDTHVLLWWLEAGGRLPRNQRDVIDRAVAGQATLLVSDISLWEIATLHELGRIRLRLSLREWLERATAPPLVQRVGISPAVAAEVASLPATFPRDPADRIIVSTARIRGATLLTSDRRIAAAGIVPTLG